MLGQPYFWEEHDVTTTIMARRTKAIKDLFFIVGGYLTIKRKKLLIILSTHDKKLRYFAAEEG